MYIYNIAKVGMNVNRKSEVFLVDASRFELELLPAGSELPMVLAPIHI